MSAAPAIQTQRGWSVETFRAFWANPDLARLQAVDGIMTDDIVGYWPRPVGTVRGPKAYRKVLEAVVTAGLKFALSVPEFATTGDFTFVRWVAKVEDTSGPIEFNGCDRVRVRNGMVCENYIFCDHPFFERVAARLKELH